MASDITADYISWLNDSAVVKYSNQRFRTHNIETCNSYLKSFRGTGNLFLAIHKGTDHVGTMTAYLSLAHGTADMGILIGNSHVWGKGVGHDAWTTLMRHLLADVGMRKVTAGTLRCNVAMVRIMVSSGMQPDGVRVAQELVDGKPQDLLHFAKFND